MKKLSLEKERILQFIEYKGLSKCKFYRETGISNGILDKTGGFTIETIEKIYSKYPEINLNWIVTGEGSMLKNEENKSSVYQSNNTNSQINNQINSTNSQTLPSDTSNSQLIQQLKSENEHLKEQIKVKDEQIKVKDEQIYKLLTSKL